MLEPCLLCQNPSPAFYKEQFYLCPTCGGIFRPQQSLPTVAAEKERYEKHHNDIHDIGHQQFVDPLVKAVVRDFLQQHRGLDFGAGKDSVVAKLFKDQGYAIEQYDPLFQPDSDLLNQKYDYIVCCEAIEHFHNPLKEFQLLKRLLNPGGKLYCMTDVYDPKINFEAWYYKNDFTHVFIYQMQTFDWLKQKIGFTGLKTEQRVIHFHN